MVLPRGLFFDVAADGLGVELAPADGDGETDALS
jgi:hypothetical protein